MKKNNYGFLLVETLVVTIFVAGVLIYMFIQFSNLKEKYNEQYNYNTVDDLYALNTIVKYIKDDEIISQYIVDNLRSKEYLDLTDCSNFLNEVYCSKLFYLEEVDQIIVLNNTQSYENIKGLKGDMLYFMSKISNEGFEKYRLVARFGDSRFATIRFGV